MREKNITIYDIANEAGVSVATVSRVMTGKAKVSADKKDRVNSIIEKYSFKPNALAKGLTDTSRKLIGIMAADIQNPFYATLTASCSKAAEKAGYTVMMCNSDGDESQQTEQLEKLRQQQVDAIIQLGGFTDELVSNSDYVKLVNKICQTTPVVVTGKLDGSSCRRVNIDERKAVSLILDYLISLDHKKIALVGGHMEVTSTYEKYQKYLEILQEKNIEFNPDYVIQGGYSYDEGYRCAKELMKVKNLPSAIIAINDISAAGVSRAVREAGLKIPKDISLVSYDNTYICSLFMPQLTSVGYDYAAFGEALVNTAINSSLKENIPLLQKIEPKLFIRESCAKAK